ncbi:ubiquitin thioesterase OTU1 [Phlebotomus papatasi]|uniref:ubiquitin thioesterase OTU1 n=1 Tax=Phlebotomus papatasi TaxID=29031 RepID=UPI0024841515|nr:ubiquitin thioesterase OTU1 [Phlebotomus papatasi]
MGFSLKVKTKTGQHILRDVSPSLTLSQLKSQIVEFTKLRPESMHILVGFPPRKLNMSGLEESITASGIVNGDTLIVEEVVGEVPSVERREDALLAAQSAAVADDEFAGLLLKKVVPADNSCLFTSIGYALNGTVNTDCGVLMRQIIAEHVAADPDTFSEAFLGRPNREYCAWILRDDSWGGAIEVFILSSFYGLEIDVVDITNAIINRFGEDKNYGQRIFLLFDGIHYDPLYLESLTGATPRTIFPVEAESIYMQAEQLAKEAQASKQFTDVNRFTLRCLVCDCHLVGQVEAQAHAKSTGHANFGEV